jgi:hypothetical protein
MIQNGIDGIYTDMFFKCNGKYKYVKFSIIYQSRCDRNGMSHPEEETAFYILHEFRINDLEEKFQIPEPGKHMDWENAFATMVNNYGRFRYAFRNEKTAKSVISHELLMMIYPYVYLLSDTEAEEWNRFVASTERARKMGKKILGLTDIELLLGLAYELEWRFSEELEKFVDEKDPQFRYLDIGNCEELKELSLADAEELSVEDIKQKYLYAALPMARKSFRNDHVAGTGLVAGPDISDEYLDIIFCLAWKNDLQMWCVWWLRNKQEGEN